MTGWNWPSAGHGKRPVGLIGTMVLALLGGLLSVIATAVPAQAAAASVTVSNAKLTGTAPVTVGQSLTLTADLSNVSGGLGDTFTINLPAELDFAGALSFPILGDYGVCSWSGKTATCTLTKAATNASGGISLWLKAVAAHTGGSTIQIGGTTVVPGIPGGSIGPGSTTGPPTTTPAVTKPLKRPGGGIGGWNDYYATHPGYGNAPVLAEWDILLPVYSTDTKVTITDSLVAGNGYAPHSYWFNTEGQSPSWTLDHWVVSNGTYDGTRAPINDVKWYESLIGVNGHSGTVTDAVLTVSADKKSFTLTFTAKANVTYQMRYLTNTDSTPVAGDLLRNNAIVSGYQTDAVIKVAGGSAWLRENYSQFSIKKAVTGAKGSSVPVGTNFTVHYTAGGVSKDLTVPYNMTSVTSDWVPAGTKFTISEVNLPSIPGVTWGDYTITGSGVMKNADGSYSVTPSAGATVALTLNNVANNPPTPGVEIVKKDAAGNDANTADSAVDLTTSDGETGLVFTITNSGTEDLTDVKVTDQVTAGSGTITGLSCDFSPLGGPATGTTWAGPFLVADKFTCTAQLAGVTSVGHADTAKVEAVGRTSRTPVDDDDPYHAKVKGKVSVGDYVWVDTDADGRQDPGEPGIPGVTLVLTGPDGKPVTDVHGNPVAPTVTDADGGYTFDNLPILKNGEQYTVTIDQTASAEALEPYVPTVANQGDRVGDSSDWSASSEGLTQDGDRDPTLDFGFVLKPVVPAVQIVKKDAAGNDANTVASSVDLTATNGATDLVFTITNSGTEDLVDVVVSDRVTAGTATVTGLSCDFSELGGPATGTTWAGPFEVGDTFDCTAKLARVLAGEQHADLASVAGVGVTSGTPVDDGDPYHATVIGKVSVGDYVWVDTDGDGRQDDGEPGIPGVTLVLTGPDGKSVTDVFGDPVTPTVTGSEGRYSFDDLPVLKDGEHYTVTIDREASAEALAPYVPTIAGQGDRAGDSSDWSASSEGLTEDGDRDPTLDFGFVLKPPTPAIEIVKKDVDGNDADAAASAVDLTKSHGETGLVFTITNSGTEDLVDVVVSDRVTAGTAPVAGLSCDFSALGGPATGTTWAGPFLVGDQFACTAELAGVTADSAHADLAKVEAVGKDSGTPVDDDNPYHALVSGKVSVGDYVWVDTDADGRQDDGEPGIPGVTLVLTGPDGKPVTDVFGDPVKPVVTDSDGKYSFDDLPVLKEGEHYTVTIDREASAEALKPYVPTVAGQGDRAGDSSDWSASSEGLTEDGDRDPTLDFGFVNAPSVPVVPAIDIVKKDAAGNDADTAESAVDLTKSDGGAGLVFTITNSGTEDLVEVSVTDQLTAGAGTISGLSCDFSKLGGPATGTTWAGPFLVADHFTCTADLTGVVAGELHADVAKVDAVGKASGTPVADDNPYHALVTGKVSVGDLVWVDTDADGRQDDGEPGIPGITLVVTGPDGKPVTDVFGDPVKAVVTDSDGKYSFDNLPVLKDGEHYTVTIDREASAEALKPYVPTVAGQGDRAGDSSDWSASSEGLTEDGDRDPTLDFGFVLKPVAPAIEIVKKDAAGNDANTLESSVDLTASAGTTELVFTIRNTGAEDLKSIVVSDSVSAGSATVSDLSCDFSELGGPSSGTTWDGPFKVGDWFNCTAKLAGVVAGDQHTDVATVTGVGVESGQPVTDDDAYHASVTGGEPPVEPVEPVEDSEDDSDGDPELAWTGFESAGLALGGVLLLAVGVLLLGARSRRDSEA